MITPEYVRTVSTGIGIVRVTAVPEGICGVTFTETQDLHHEAPGAPVFLEDAVRQLEEYFSCKRKDFHSLPLVMRSTDFQQEVWDAALMIPYGQTWTYGSLAERIGKPDAARAVGNALNRNPICIVVPCHRIVASTPDGGGYGGGAWRKEWLLDLEKRA